MVKALKCRTLGVNRHACWLANRQLTHALLFCWWSVYSVFRAVRGRTALHFSYIATWQYVQAIYKVWSNNAHVRFPRSLKWLTTQIDVPYSKCWISAMERFQRKPHKIFISLPVTSISGWTDTPAVRCGLTDRHTHKHTEKPNYSNSRCTCVPRKILKITTHFGKFLPVFGSRPATYITLCN